MKLHAFPANFWIYHDTEKLSSRTFIPLFQDRLIQLALSRPSDVPLKAQDLLALLIILLHHYSAQGLQLQAKAHFLRFLPFLTRLEPFPCLHNLLMHMLSVEWFGYMSIYSLD